MHVTKSLVCCIRYNSFVLCVCMYVYVCMVLSLCLVTITLLYPTQCTACFVHEAIKLFEFEFEFGNSNSLLHFWYQSIEV